MAKATKGAGELELSDHPTFDYKNLTGEEFKRYIEYVDSLGWFDKVYFELYHAEGVFAVELDANMDKIRVLKGINIKNDKPIHTTRIPAKDAKELNRQIEQNTAHGTGKYYLLKQNHES